MAKIYRAQRDFVRAADFSARALKLGIEVQGARDVGPQRYRTDLAFDLARQGRFREAEPHAREAYEILSHGLAMDSRFTRGAAAVLVDVLHGLGRDREAEQLARPFVTAMAATTPDAWQAFQWKSLLGATLAGQGKFGEAGSLLLAGYGGMRQRLKTMDAPERVVIGVAAGWLADFFAASSRPAEAAEWRRKASEN